MIAAEVTCGGITRSASSVGAGSASDGAASVSGAILSSTVRIVEFIEQGKHTYSYVHTAVH
jgi:hypothetical protein